MTDFYHRYRSLFELVNQPVNNHSFKDKKTLFQSANQKNQSKPSFTPQPEVRKQSYFANLNRSPALQEFESSILPKLSKKLPLENIKRLETQIYDSNRQFQSDLQKNHLGRQFYQLPKINSEKPHILKRERIVTEGNKPTRQMKQSKVRFRNVKNISHNMQNLEKEYLKYYPKHEDSIREEVCERPAGISNHKKIKTQYQQESRVNQMSPSTMQKKWELKVLPEKKSSKHYQGLIPSPKHNENTKNQQREYQDRQKQLFGIKQNPFAFVNSKVDEIKRSEKYYPRGYINSYRDALFRRRKQKNNIQERRQKLRTMLYEQDIKYGVI